MSKLRRERKRERQGKSRIHKPIKNKQYSKKSLFSDVIIFLCSLSIGVYFISDYLSKYGFTYNLNCHKSYSSCDTIEVFFGGGFILVAGFKVIHIYIMTKNKYA